MVFNKDISGIQNEIAKRDLNNRVKLIDVETDEELEKLFENTDFVAFPAQKRIVKDVPNSLIDGLCKGKPIIISDILNFSNVVEKNNIGFVIKDGSLDLNLNLSIEEYEKLSTGAYEYSKVHSKENYVKVISDGYFCCNYEDNINKIYVKDRRKK